MTPSEPGGYLKPYRGTVPACGVFCGGCPVYRRAKNPCPGAGADRDRCERCKTFHRCCAGKGITHCYECGTFPCAAFRKFAARWLVYGQDFIENQKLLKQVGEPGFIKMYNGKMTGHDNSK